MKIERCMLFPEQRRADNQCAGDGMMAVVAAAEKLHASHVAAADDVATKQAAAAKRAKRAKVRRPPHSL
jgi:hypothetical protein